MRPISTYYGANRRYEKMVGIDIHWPSKVPPLDVPICGFSGEKLSCQEPDKTAVIVSSIIILVVLVLSASLVVFIIRQKIKYENNLAGMIMETIVCKP